MASEQARLTATGDVGAAGKSSRLLSVVVEGTGTATFRTAGAGGAIKLLIVSGTWTAGAGDGVGYPEGIHYTKGAETSVSVEYTQMV